MQFFNSAILIIIANMKIDAVKNIIDGEGFEVVRPFIPILSGMYFDITIEWHENVGKMICMVLVAHIMLN